MLKFSWNIQEYKDPKQFFGYGVASLVLPSYLGKQMQDQLRATSRGPSTCETSDRENVMYN